MSVRRPILIITVLAAALLASCTRFHKIDPPGPPSPDVVKLLQGYDLQAKSLRNAEVKVTFEGSIPDLQNQGTMEALRTAHDGKIEYQQLSFKGDDRVRKSVFFEFMKQEVSPAADRPDASISTRNYQFVNKGMQQREDRDVVVFEVTPRQKRVGLFKGEIWADPETGFAVREEGTFVKSPSIFFRKMSFKRVFELLNGAPRLKTLESKIETRIVGPVNLTINFGDVKPLPAPQVGATPQSRVTTSGSARDKLRASTKKPRP